MTDELAASYYMLQDELAELREENERLRGELAVQRNGDDDVLTEIANRLGKSIMVDTGAADPFGHGIEIERWNDYDGAGDDVALLLGRVHWMRKKLAPQPCGHPAAAIASSDEGTHYCRWCADVAAAHNEGWNQALTAHVWEPEQ